MCCKPMRDKPVSSVLQRFALWLFVPCLLMGILSAQTARTIEVRRPTVVAFYVPQLAGEDPEKDGTDEALSDFRFYLGPARKALKAMGMNLELVEAPSFQVRLGGKARIFRPAEAVGYYLIAPGKEPRIEYGVMTDLDIVQVAKEYLALRVPSVVFQGREFNLLLNPMHPDFSQIEVEAPEPVVWDPRLFRRLV